MGLLDSLLGSLAGGMGNAGLSNATGNATGNATANTNNPLGDILGSVLGGGHSGPLSGDSFGQPGAGMGGIGAAALPTLIMLAMQMIQQHGGLSAVLGKLQQQGLGAEANSWVSTGANAPVSGGKLSEILGSGSIDQVAQQLGVTQSQAADGLAHVLPQIISHMTPDGQVPANHGDLLSEAMGELMRYKT